MAAAGHQHQVLHTARFRKELRHVKLREHLATLPPEEALWRDAFCVNCWVSAAYLTWQTTPASMPAVQRSSILSHQDKCWIIVHLLAGLHEQAKEMKQVVSACVVHGAPAHLPCRSGPS